MDETKRRRYDSTLEFNNEIPKSFEEGEDFFDVFSHYFEINAYWSKNKNVPDLGDENTDMK